MPKTGSWFKPNRSSRKWLTTSGDDSANFADGVPQDKVVHGPPPQLESTLSPCGASCWLKDFLRCPNVDVATSSPPNLPGPPASEDQRRAVANRLHTPIRSWQTRLIKITPGSGQDDLECDLVVADIIHSPGLGIISTDEVVQYEALSYSWGYPAFTDRVFCNNIEVPVTQTLGVALRQFRLPTSPRYIWTDAFCINQFDPEEKSRQVRNVLVIYQKAKAVLAWIGMLEGNDRRTLFYVNHIATSDTPIRNDQGRYHDLQCAELYQTRSEDLNRLFSKPWFARTWIRQEVFASAALTLHCESLEYDMGTIWRAMDVWNQCQPSEEATSSLRKQSIINQDTIEAMRQSRISVRRWLSSNVKLDAPVRRAYHTGLWMEGLLTGFRFGATDPRDRIYGILGMLEERSKVLNSFAPHSEDPQLASFDTSVDYNRSNSLVLQDVIKHLINRDRNLLPLCVFGDRSSISHDIPTWAFDLADGKRRWYVASHLDDTHEALQLRDMYCYGLHDFFREGPVSHAAPVDLKHKGQLKIVGHMVGSIRKCSQSRVLISDEAGYTHVTTSLPRTGFYHFLKSGHELSEECAYRAYSMRWCRDITFLKGRSTYADCVKYALASHTATDEDLVVLAYGSPMPLVLRPHDVGSGKYYFLGPACLLIELGLFDEPKRVGWFHPGAAQAMAKVDEKVDLEEFVLV